MTNVVDIATRARRASQQLAVASSEAKNQCLRLLAERLQQNTAAVLSANEADMRRAEEAGLATAKLRRLQLQEASVQGMVEGLRQVAELPDPVGAVTRDDVVASGLRVQKTRCPIGVVMMIYEARPNVTVDAFALCMKAGNACILKGGREAGHSNEGLLVEIQAALREAGLPEDAVQLVTGSDREEMKLLLQQSESIDLVIPRGGPELIRFVHENSAIPTVQHFHGVCHVYVHGSADLDKALQICVTGKTSAPATCNATEAVLVDADVAAEFVPRLLAAYREAGVEVRGDASVQQLAGGQPMVAAGDGDFGHEFLDLIVAMRVVAGLDQAIEHIRQHGSNHTEVIVAQDQSVQQRFTQQVQSSCVLVNASSRFNDGFQLGLGAEIGISTSRVHAYGPMGLEELTTQRYIAVGDGQTR